jgi:hypothetical protein
LKKEVEFEYLASLAFSYDTVQEIFDKIIYEYCEGGIIEIGIAPDTEGKLQALDETLTLDTIFANEVKKTEIENLIKSQIKSYITTYIRKNLEKFGLQENFLDWILTCVAKTVTNPDETGN